MKRRYFLAFLCSPATESTVAATARQTQSTRRMAVFSYQAADDPEAQLYMEAFLKRLQQLGWTVGQNLHVDYRWTETNAERIGKYAAELVELSPEVVLTAGGTHVEALQRANSTLPIVFVHVADAVGGGYVKSQARPRHLTR